ncbi:glycosyltransferase [Ruegeria sp. ANG-R]|uniref:glycosyltransferase n=1 Tax=Ruegeria sp. ANG-R TaxID=1577903 RepID=UPI00187CAB14|nr:glycosyltransferase [Ruegeria sp. ANG-R]
MDQVEVAPDILETGLELRPENKAALAARLSNAAVVLALLSPDETDTVALCRQIGLPVVFVSEYSPRTELQIINVTTPNPLRRLRRRLYVMGAERKRRRLARDYAAGLQCNGTPTYEIYAPIAPDAFLYFDNRVRAKDVIDDQMLEAKCTQMNKGAPLRLVFGGRLSAMKGVLELPQVAQALDRLKVPYQMDIYGSGDQEEVLRHCIAERALSDRVVVHPPVDFSSEWIPFLKQNADLFVCCHPQGDPSSTYTEVMSCGVPIVGYANEAFAGVVSESGAGWCVPLGDAAGLAAQIEKLHNDRAALREMAYRGRNFGASHCFEPTFHKRATHLIRASRLPQALKSQSLEGRTGI